MHKLTFFPLGNADCIRIELANGRQLLFDYAAMRDESDKDDLRIDLPTRLRDDLRAAKRTDYDVVAFTHLDDDHVKGAADFFWLEHATKYQGKDRIKITELWVPAAALTEEGCEDDARVIRQEARHRLKAGKGVRVFSRPERLKEWLEKQTPRLTVESRRGLITDAGQIVPGFALASDDLEFFVHSPFAVRQNEKDLEDRNEDALVLHASFQVDGVTTRALLTSDITHGGISDIVQITRQKKRDERLVWDILDVPHHCSYTALADDKGKDVTEPVKDVKWLYEKKGQKGCIIVSGSKVIPSNDEDPQPPHRQAANYYRRCADEHEGEFKVTMEHPDASRPEPLVIEIDGTGGRIAKKIAGGVASVLGTPAPRAG